MSGRRISLRSVEVIGEKSYTQGYGMTWDDLDIRVDLDEGERIERVETFTRAGGGFDGMLPAVRVWISREDTP